MVSNTSESDFAMVFLADARSSDFTVDGFSSCSDFKDTKWGKADTLFDNCHGTSEHFANPLDPKVLQKKHTNQLPKKHFTAKYASNRRKISKNL